MKYLLLVGDGMADYPLKELGDKTVLEVARTPNLDHLASCGEIGRVRTIPEEMDPGSDVAILSILGYDPKIDYPGRAPLEAAARGISLKSDEVAFRLNLVTVHQYHLRDYSAGHIKTEVAKELIEFLNDHLGDSHKRFYPGVSYRHLLVLKGDFGDVKCTPPHDIIGQEIKRYLPSGRGASYLTSIMYTSYDLLKDHPINLKRRELQEEEANMAWLWGQGKAPTLSSLKDRFGLEGMVIADVDLIKGIGVSIGLKVIEVKGATGYLDTDYTAMAQAALDALEEVDFVFFHVEAPDEAGHLGDIEAKKRAIEEFDEKVVGKVLKEVSRFGSHRILVLSDHPTPISLRTHTKDPVPFVLYDSCSPKDRNIAFNEMEAKRSPLFIEEGYRLIEYFLKE
ncbi:TPA: cofactor-independent phosphoglycerate mutase [bacterium]|nr:cofactor-independent phosphoglycerate mutase [bacterium]